MSDWNRNWSGQTGDQKLENLKHAVESSADLRQQVERLASRVSELERKVEELSQQPSAA